MVVFLFYTQAEAALVGEREWSHFWRLSLATAAPFVHRAPSQEDNPGRRHSFGGMRRAVRVGFSHTVDLLRMAQTRVRGTGAAQKAAPLVGSAESAGYAER